MSNLLNIFKSFSKILLLMAKISFIFISIYYILNYDTYKIKFSVLTSLRKYAIINAPLELLESIGLMFLIIPLVIVLISFYHTESRFLQIISNIFAASGNIFTLFHSVSKGLLEEYFRTLFFTVYNAPSYESKVSLFGELFNQRVKLYSNDIVDKQGFALFAEKNLKDSWNVYSDNIKTLPSDKIINFANQIADNIKDLYFKQINPIIPDPLVYTNVSTTSYTNMIIFGLGFTIICAIAIGFIYYKSYHGATIIRQNSDALVEHAHRIQKVAQDTVLSSGVVTAANEGLKVVVDNINKCTADVKYLDNSYKELAENVENNASLLKGALKDIANLYNKLQNPDLNKTELLSITNEMSPYVETIKHQISALAKNGVDVNKEVSLLGAKVDLFIKDINSIIKNEVQEIISNSSPIISTQSQTSTTTLFADAADKRLIEDARNIINSFNLDTSVGNVKTLINQKLQNIIRDLNDKVDQSIITSNQKIDKNIASYNVELKNLKSQDINHNKQILDFKEEISKMSDTQTMQVKVTEQLSGDLKKTTTHLSEIEKEVNNVKDISLQLKEESVQNKSHFSDLDTTLSEMKQIVKSLRKIPKKVLDCENMTSDKMQAINSVVTDNYATISKFTEFFATKINQVENTVKNLQDQFTGVIDLVKQLSADESKIATNTYSTPLFTSIHNKNAPRKL